MWPALISAGASLINGLMSSSSSKSAIAAQEAMNAQNIQNQIMFAQNGIQWKAADARQAEAKYGINPLVSMGAPTSSFSNVVGSFPTESPMGQGIERAGQALAGINTRQDELKNKLLEAQIANVNSDTVKNQAAASKVATSVPGTPPPLWQDFSDGKGGIIRLPSAKASSAMQNWASMPAQIPIAASQIGDAINYEYHKLMDPVTGWIKSHGHLPVRGDAYRAADPSQYVPF